MPEGPTREKQASARAVFNAYWSAVRAYPWSLAVIFGSAIVMQLSSLASPLYLRQFFNVLAGAGQASAASTDLVPIIAAIAGLLLLNWVMTRIQNVANIRMQSEVMQHLYAESFEYLL